MAQEHLCHRKAIGPQYELQVTDQGGEIDILEMKIIFWRLCQVPKQLL